MPCGSPAGTSGCRPRPNGAERNPWLAFEEGFRTVRGFVQHLEGGALGPLQARLGEDLQALAEGSATAVLAIASPSAVRALSDDEGFGWSGPPTPKVRLVLGQPPMRPSLDRLAVAYHGTAWTLGREAASLLPIDALAELVAARAVALAGRHDRAGARRGRAVDGPRRAGRAAGGWRGEARRRGRHRGASAGYRVVVARGWPTPTTTAPASSRWCRRARRCRPGRGPAPTSRCRRAGGSGDPDVVPSRGLFAPPERFDQRPFSAGDAAKVVTETAVETLRARGEPARYERLFGEILVGLDRSGHLRRLSTGTRPSDDPPKTEDQRPPGRRSNRRDAPRARQRADRGRPRGRRPPGRADLPVAPVAPRARPTPRPTRSSACCR